MYLYLVRYKKYEIKKLSDYTTLINSQKCYERNTNFEIGDKLEAVDKSNLHLTCVATVSDIIDDRILIHFDGWNHNYDFWCDNNSNYIHAIGWCSAYNETLSVPQGM